MTRLLAAAVLAVSPVALLGPVSAVAATVPAPGSAIIALPLQPVVPAAQRTCASKTASGLGYTVLRAGTGAKPGATDYVLINYIGYLAANGQAFDQGQQAPLQVNGVIPGFSEGLQRIEQGAIYRFCIPSALGYGATATGPIPAGSDLVFQVELVDSKTAAEVDAMRQRAQTGPTDPAPAGPTP